MIGYRTIPHEINGSSPDNNKNYHFFVTVFNNVLDEIALWLGSLRFLLHYLSVSVCN